MKHHGQTTSENTSIASVPRAGTTCSGLFGSVIGCSWVIAELT
jgi:hypothetical protein